LNEANGTGECENKNEEHIVDGFVRPKEEEDKKAGKETKEGKKRKKKKDKKEKDKRKRDGEHDDVDRKPKKKRKRDDESEDPDSNVEKPTPTLDAVSEKPAIRQVPHHRS
jgi:hypothetical protein